MALASPRSLVLVRRTRFAMEVPLKIRMVDLLFNGEFRNPPDDVDVAGMINTMSKLIFLDVIPLVEFIAEEFVTLSAGAKSILTSPPRYSSWIGSYLATKDHSCHLSNGIELLSAG